MMMLPVHGSPRTVLVFGFGVVAAFAGCSAPGSGSPDGPTSRSVAVAPGVEADRASREVRVKATVACDRGWLEQAVCRAGTRDHESLLSVEAPPSAIHAALLLLGLEPGAPGSWREAPGTADGVERVPPRGPSVELWVRSSRGEVPLSSWIHDPVHGARFDAQPWLFAGSTVRPNTRSMGPGEHFVADRTGSVVGLVTFGDELIAYREVLPDRAEVAAPQWQARTEAMPPYGEPVLLIVRIPPRSGA